MDLVRFFALRAQSRRATNGHVDWTNNLPPDVTDRNVINRSYFGAQISKDCDQPDPSNKRPSTPNNVRSQFGNVVRILSKLEEQTTVRTGLVVSDETVVTVGSYRHAGELELLPDDTEIQVVSCGQILATYKMKSARPISAKGKSPYLRLVVPGLKAEIPAPSFAMDDEKPWAFGKLYAVGYLALSEGLFRDRSERLRDRSEKRPDNNDRRVFRAEHIPNWTSVGDDDDDASDFDLDIPVAAGMIGSPGFFK